MLVIDEVKVETTELVRRLVEVVTVETIVEVEVVENSPPKGPKRKIVESALVEIVVKPGFDPTIHPLSGEIMYTEVKIGGTPLKDASWPNSAGESVM